MGPLAPPIDFARHARQPLPGSLCTVAQDGACARSQSNDGSTEAGFLVGYKVPEAIAEGSGACRRSPERKYPSWAALIVWFPALRAPLESESPSLRGFLLFTGAPLQFGAESSGALRRLVPTPRHERRGATAMG